MDGLIEGRIVHYVLTGYDVQQINRRRVPGVGQGDNWPAGAQAHVGNSYSPGEHVAMVVVKVHNEQGVINGQCCLDGNDQFWVTSATFDEDLKFGGTWHWIERS